MNGKKYIGLSLSRCMIDILDETVDVKDIAGIITSTRFEEPEQAMEYYYNGYWSGFATEDQARLMLLIMWPMIFQPRLSDPLSDGHRTNHGFWLDLETGKCTSEIVKEYN